MDTLMKALFFLLAALLTWVLYKVICDGSMYLRLWWLERAIDKELKRRQKFREKYCAQSIIERMLDKE